MSRRPPDARLVPIDPTELTLDGVVHLERAVHQDPRGLLVETLRADDASVAGDQFVMSYTSVTVPGEFRDKDRWHVHKLQTDRFVVPLGEMILALWDGRAESPTRGRLEVVRMAGPPTDRAGENPKRDSVTHLVTIPPGVHHCIGNLGQGPFVLLNYPTRYYDPADEGRVPFLERPIAELGGPFSWDLVARAAPSGA